MDLKKTIDVLSKGAEQLLPKGELEEALKKKKRLKIKLGMDPTAPDLHLGHAVVLQKLKDFQDQGHEVIFLIGDFTAQIGDPSGRSKARPPLTKEQVEENAKTYFEQVGKILDRSKTTIRYNSEWFSAMSFSDCLALSGRVTLARVIERDDFQKRIGNNQPIGLHELMYPVMQAYDSVMLDADVELGGSDQTFNLLMGRFLQEQFDKDPQVVLTLSLLEGLDGSLKMSKTAQNYVGLQDSPADAYGKIMSISDELMWRYYELLLRVSKIELEDLKTKVASGRLHPMDLKKDMALQIVERFWSQKEAVQAQESFEAIFQKHDYSKAQEVALSVSFKSPCWIVDLLRALGAIKTSSEAKRLIEDGAVSVDDKEVRDFKAEVSYKKGSIVKVGKKRIYKIS